MLPFFNEVAGKQISLLWASPFFWLAGISFSLITGLLAGIYPAFYLSSFKPIQVLKGTFQTGTSAVIPRKVLVVVQFTVSITLIIGTLIVYQQVQFGKNRPVGYTREGLIMVETPTEAIHTHFSAIQNELKKEGAITEMSESLNPMTGLSFSANGYDWDGTGAHREVSFGTVYVDHDFGKTVGWQFKEGRDFSREFSTDSSGIVLNETAAAFMGLKDPVGQTIQQNDFNGLKTYRIIGIIKDMVMESPYEPVRQTVYKLNADKGNFVNIRINPAISTREALQKIESIFKKYTPESPFEYRFVDEEYAQKFKDEERISKIASFFAVLAIMISCLGIFGLASFVAQQRVKELGIRKVLGATAFNIWGLLSRDFVVLVLVAYLIAVPVSYYFLSHWLENYSYRTNIAWWVFALAGGSTLLITLLTVSYQSIKAALVNPVDSLRNE
jgi:ABC-type antimicrobial peptide transport system permease subunit